MYLAKLAGMDVPTPYPVTRQEMFLAACVGVDVQVPFPKFRDEWFLFDLASKYIDTKTYPIVGIGQVGYMVI